MAQSRQARRQGAGRGSPRPKAGEKKEQIIAVATDFFGRYGYEQTKWADVAAEVDIGSTALYHYFESKQHCLYEIMSRTLAEVQQRFDRVVASQDEWSDALVEILVSNFHLTDEEVLRMRVLVAEHGRVATARGTTREEAARGNARSRKRALEFAWGAFLARGMQEGVVPENDAQLLARALLGLFNSVWTWYRPGGSLALHDVARFYVGRQLALLGLDPSLADARMAALAAD